ncbi:hypothetical protein BAE44_0020861 [Dichanthelium oligosanthes]|uniref:Uncharacterized protein n=1 Tax=Dichanthelium oligosanthes TaxID=888268 RepID=A0A1E5UZ46_9POAL|nr:hypothetical protein BAE44_0020861 [Dichanthelium oligosanthes]
MRTLPFLRRYRFGWSAAVLCASYGDSCDHLGCHRGPFLVVALGSRETFPCIYSSEAAAWSEPRLHLLCL